MSPRSLSGQLLAVNALLITAAVFAAAVAARLSFEEVDEERQALVLAAGILASLLVNGLVVRRRFAPLERLIGVMERVDGDTAQDVRAVRRQADSAEVARLTDAFNAMLERLEAERAATAGAVLRGQEAERARIARDLHDECNQALTGVLLRIELAAQDAPGPVREQLREARHAAAQAMDELLRLARELRPTALDDLGLDAALRTLTAGRASLEVFCDLRALGEDEQVVVYRVVQEALSNATRHAPGAAIRVAVGAEAGATVVRIADDGPGFDPRAVTDGLGLAGMRERARLAGGRLDIRSSATPPARGTVVELRLTEEDRACAC